MTVAERMRRAGWRKHPRKDMDVWSKQFSGCEISVTHWFIRGTPMHEWCAESDGDRLLGGGREGLRDLAQRAKAAARRLARKGKR